MAMRSYLYSADTLPTDTEIPDKVLGISEHNWDIPLAHLLLTGRDPRVVPSMIWSAPVGIGADFDGGADLLLSVLSLVGKGDVAERDDFDELVRKITDHLGKQRKRYLLLEAGEILQARGGADTASEEGESAFLKLIREVIDTEIEPATRRAEAALSGGDDAWVESLRRNWRNHFASFYSPVLYFSFSDGTA
ncbi:DUF7822 domain-containing protein [Saccharomonospora glauca]|uniref:DUF7822 domain-containing protein n=1 Tax=Saccharomonospora glauca K62 TaxID=928724 RepID=I1D1G3_9PSEU|nr:hypothetical protein [Saccharomonospora glauca]EIE98787.1 hypothetical protein SacglDRAFT_01877 [Saccharomonospora glauca K62]